MFPSRRATSGFGVPPPRTSNPTGSRSTFGGHNWGRGRVLGGDVD